LRSLGSAKLLQSTPRYEVAACGRYAEACAQSPIAWTTTNNKHDQCHHQRLNNFGRVSLLDYTQDYLYRLCAHSSVCLYWLQSPSLLPTYTTEWLAYANRVQMKQLSLCHQAPRERHGQAREKPHALSTHLHRTKRTRDLCPNPPNPKREPHIPCRRMNTLSARPGPLRPRMHSRHGNNGCCDQ